MVSTHQRSFASLALVATVVLSGCTTLGPVYQPESAPPADKATIYVYRDFNVFGGAVSYVVRANGVPLGRLPAGGYFLYHAEPGEVEFSAHTLTTTSVTVDAKVGEVYYVKGTVGIGLFVGQPHLVLVSKDAALKEITGCKLVPESEMAKKSFSEFDRVTVPSDEGAATTYQVTWYSGVDYLASFAAIPEAEQWALQGALQLTDRSLTLVLGSDARGRTGMGLHVPYHDIASVEISSFGLNRAAVIKRRDGQVDSFQIRGILVDRAQTQQAGDLLRTKVEAERASTTK